MPVGTIIAKAGFTSFKPVLQICLNSAIIVADVSQGVNHLTGGRLAPLPDTYDYLCGLKTYEEYKLPYSIE